MLVLAAVAILASRDGAGSSQPAETTIGNITVLPAGQRPLLPDFRGEAVQPGQPPVDLSALRGDRPMVINFWATWCGPCRAEQQGLERASRRLASRGVQFVGINTRDDRGAATSYLEEFKVSYPSLFDRAGVFAARLGRSAPSFLPYTLVVDADGRIAAKVFGALPGKGADEQVAVLTRIINIITTPSTNTPATTAA